MVSRINRGPRGAAPGLLEFWANGLQDEADK